MSQQLHHAALVSEMAIVWSLWHLAKEAGAQSLKSQQRGLLQNTAQLCTMHEMRAACAQHRQHHTMIVRTCEGSRATRRAGLWAREQGGMLSTCSFDRTLKSHSRVLVNSPTVFCRTCYACGRAVHAMAVDCGA